MAGLPVQKNLQPQNNDTLWYLNSNSISGYDSHNLVLEASGHNIVMNNYINNINQSTIGYQYFQLPKGTTSQRPTAPLQGYFRFNTSIKLLEFYDGSSWITIAASPQLSSIFPTKVTQPNYDICLNGVNFTTGANVEFIGTDGTIYISPQITFINSRQIIAQSPSIPLTISNEPYDVKIINNNGLTAILQDVLSTGDEPQFSTPAGSLGTIYDSFRTNGSYSLLDISASDPDGDVITYDICGGSLPTGLSLNSTTGVISGTASQVVNTTTYAFTVGAVTFNATTTRQFSITINQPVTLTYSFNVSSYEQYFSIPSGLLGITVKMWGAGGGQYHANTYGDVDGTGGPGGYSQSTINFLPGETTLTLVVGEGGSHNRTGGYGGGGGGYNGGAGGGGASLLLSGSLSGTFNEVLTGTPYTNGSIPQSNILNLNGASGVIMVAGGGGGAGWYNTSDANGGCGGGINGSSNSGGYGTAGGGTQSSGGAGGGTGTGSGQGLGTSGTYLGGGYVTFNSSGGGSGGGGGGWYGGGCYQGNGGNNAGGGGGSGFVGFSDGTSPNKGTSGTLSENTSGTPIGYTDATTRTNGSRTYTNSVTLRTGNQTTGNGIFAPPYISDNDYPGNKIGYGGEQTQNNSTLGENGKNGAIVIKY